MRVECEAVEGNIMANANEILLQNTAKGVMATLYGPKAQEIVSLFGTDTIPCPFSGLSEDTAAAYVRQMRQSWPGFVVSFV
jgi:hypothetical protein